MISTSLTLQFVYALLDLVDLITDLQVLCLMILHS